MADDARGLPEDQSRKLVSFAKSVDAEYEAHRLRLYLKAQRNDLYYRGVNRVAPKLAGDRVFMAPVEMRSADGAEIREYSVNKIRGDGRKLISIIGQKHPNVNAVPQNPRSEEDRAAAREYEKAAAVLREWWKMPELQMRAILYLYKYGTLFGFVRWVSDGHRYGYREEPVYEQREVVAEPGRYTCPACGGTQQADEIPQACNQCGAPADSSGWVEPEKIVVPVVVDTKRYPRGRVELTLTNMMHVRVPLHASSLEECDYLIYEYEVPRHRAIAAFPDLRDKLQNADSTGGSNAGALARASIASPSGGRLQPANMVTYTLVWLRPAMFEAIEDAKLREQMKSNYPDGVRLTIVGDELVSMEADRIDDHWAFALSQPSDTVYSDPLLDDMIDFQDAYTDALTIAIETLQRGLPITLFSPDVIDPKKLAQTPALPAEMIPVRAGAGNNIQNAIVTVPTARFPDELPKFMAAFEEDVRDATGIRPELWGGGPAGGTATEYIRRQNQALAQHGAEWLFLRQFWARMFDCGVRELARYAAEEIVVPTSEGSGATDVEVIDLAALQAGSAHFESDEAIPLNMAQQREYLQQLLTGMPPDVAQALGVFHPSNIGILRELLGLPDMVVPLEDAREKVAETINELLKDKPVPGPDGQLMPSIMPDDVEDDPSVVLEVCREWMQSPAGRRQKQKNPDGYANVRAYVMAVQAMMPPPGPPEGAEPVAKAPAPQGGSGSPDEPPEPPESQPPPAEGPLPDPGPIGLGNFG
jgi:hypothetical protein